MAVATNGSQAGLTKGARITGDQRSSLGESFGQRYASGESIRQAQWGISPGRIENQGMGSETGWIERLLQGAI